MNLMEASIEGMRRIAVANSEGQGIDEHWESVLPEIKDIFENEIFLTLHRLYIDEPMKCEAAQIAQKVSLPDISDLDDAKLTLHCTIREVWLGISDCHEFQTFVDDNIRGFIHPPDPTYWVNPSGIWLPISEGTVKQIFFLLIERYKQACFAQHCYAELVRRGRKSEVKKYTSVLVADSGDMRQEQNEAMQWFCNKSREIAPDVGEEALQDWLEELSGLPPHVQMQKLGVTLTAIAQGAIDMRRKGGQYKPIPLEDELANAIPNESTESFNEEDITDEEFSQRLLANQKKIEDILSEGRAELGERRFQVLQILIDTPTLTSTEIAKRLNVSKQTIGRDREVIKQSYIEIQEILDL